MGDSTEIVLLSTQVVERRVYSQMDLRFIFPVNHSWQVNKTTTGRAPRRYRDRVRRLFTSYVEI